MSRVVLMVRAEQATKVFRGRSDAYVAQNVIVKEQESVLQFHETLQRHALWLLGEVNTNYEHQDRLARARGITH